MLAAFKHRHPAIGLAFLLASAALSAAPKNGAPPHTMDEAVEWLGGYLQVDTSNPPGNESLAASYLARILHQEGISTRLLVTPEGRVNLYARLAAAEAREGALVLLHHMDVVPAGDGWTRNPWAAEIDEGRMWGRGAIDSKSLGVSHLAALIDLKRQQTTLKRDVIFLAVADEETGGSRGTKWLLEEHADLFEGVTSVLNEGGSNRASGERLGWWGIEVAQKRPLWLRVETRGRGGHGSTFNPMSAVHQLLAGLEKVLKELPPPRVTVAARDYFGALADFHGEAFREVFGGPDLSTVEREFQRMMREGRSGQVLLPGMIAFFQDTLQVTSIETPTNTINVVPAAASALLDIRLLPDTPVEEMLAIIRKGLGRSPSIEVLLTSPVASPSPTDSATYRTLTEVLGVQAPLVPSFITGTTDSRYFRERGIPAYGFSPFVLNGNEVRGIHGADESIPVQKFRQGLETMREVVQACAAG